MDSLSRVCEFALTYRRELPDFVCEQTTTSSASTGRSVIPLAAQPITVFKAQVTFEKGREYYSDITVNGKPLDPNSADRTMNFMSFGELGSNLVDLFTPPVVAQFQFRREASLGKIPSSVYDFHIPANKNTFWGVSDYYRKVRLHPEYEGELWIARDTARLLRLELRPVHLPPDFVLDSADTTIDYTEVTITDAGTFLLPSASVTTACTRNQEPVSADFQQYQSVQCKQHVLTFHDCRKFGSKVRIVPSNPQP